MGCDIHLHAEVKIGGQWHHYSAPTTLRRNYRLFAFMANVRNDDDIVPLAMPRGLPSDITAVTAIDLEIWRLDGHSHSWLNAEEIGKVETFIEDNLYDTPADSWQSNRDFFGYFFGNDFGQRDPWPEGVEDVRFVFWFDN